MTVFVEDTFTASDGTQLTSHGGETGATWTINLDYSYGPNNYNASVVINDGRLRRPYYGADNDNSYGGVSVYPSGDPLGSEYYVELGIVVREFANATIYLLEDADTEDANEIAEIPGYDTGGDFPITEGVEFIYRLEVHGTDVKVYIDDVEYADLCYASTTPIGKIGLQLFDSGGNDALGVNYFKIASFADEGPEYFWTANVKTEETIL